MHLVLQFGKYLKMPDPNKPNPNQPAGGPTDQPSAPPVVSPQADLPPLPPDFSALGAALAEPAGSAAPPETPSIISTPKKKYGGGRIIATILGILLLIGGIAGGVILTQQQQNIREKAQESPTDCSNGCTYDQAHVGAADPTGGLGGDCNGACPGEPDSNLHGYYTNDCSAPFNNCKYYRIDTSTSGGGGGNRLPLKSSVCPAGTVADFTDRANSVFKCCKVNPYPQFTGTKCRKQGGRVKWLGVSNCKGAGFVREQIAPCKVVNPAQCSSIQAYDTSWKALTQADLIKLKAGASLNFCVAGSPSPASFDKARFTINEVLKPDTTARRLGSTSDFCQSYTIQAEDETVDVTAQIHHPTQGWK